MGWKRRHFKVVLSLGNRNKSAGAKSGERDGWMGNNVRLMFCRVTAEEERRASRRIVVVQHPSLVFPQFWPLPAHSFPQPRCFCTRIWDSKIRVAEVTICRDVTLRHNNYQCFEKTQRHFLDCFTNRARKTAKGDCYISYVHPSHGKTRLPLEKVSRNFIFEYFSKTCP
jgi:hypothetical protein